MTQRVFLTKQKVYLTQKSFKEISPTSVYYAKILPTESVHDAKELSNFPSSDEVCQRSGCSSEQDAGGESGNVEDGDVRLAEAVVVVQLQSKQDQEISREKGEQKVRERERERDI